VVCVSGPLLETPAPSGDLFRGFSLPWLACLRHRALLLAVDEKACSALQRVGIGHPRRVKLALVYTHTRAHTHTHSHAHTLTHTCIHTHMHKYRKTHTLTYTHTLGEVLIIEKASVPINMPSSNQSPCLNFLTGSLSLWCSNEKMNWCLQKFSVWAGEISNTLTHSHTHTHSHTLPVGQPPLPPNKKTITKKLSQLLQGLSHWSTAKDLYVWLDKKTVLNNWTLRSTKTIQDNSTLIEQFQPTTRTWEQLCLWECVENSHSGQSEHTLWSERTHTLVRAQRSFLSSCGSTADCCIWRETW